MANPSQNLGYDYTVAKWFMFACILFGIIGMGIGTLIAFQLAFPELNNIAGEYSTFGRLRPLHTNGVVYGFMLSGIWATWYYVGQRVLKVSMKESKFLMFIGKAHFIIFMITILLAVVSLFAGVTTSKEYAELEWPFDIAVVVIWVLWGMGIFGLIGIRREKSLYISIWYYIATFLGVAMLYLFNNMEVPTKLVTGMGSWLHSVSMYAGSNDALIQWWWGHNAVAFVFTVAIIAEIYYFLPKESGQPVFSYKLSLFSFWSLMFIYLWAGGHHLIYSTVPDWMQTMGSIFSVVLILPSWGSAINILLTMKGEWHQVKESPLIKFMIFASTFYMFSTLEGSIQSVKSINALAHFTDWIPGHVHDGTLGWVGFMTMAAIYHMTPRVFKKEIYSKKIMEYQFTIQTLGIVLFFSSMWIAGITQGMMWRAYDDYGTLTYSFIDTVIALHPYFIIRAIGGLLYLIGFFMFAYNIYKSVTSSRSVEVEPKSASPMQA
ncbi:MULTISPECIES: cytochrome-c oxidase, cbb3-type subunit I [unclassified Campylobacter]|uniref:cytochrome-c oxidase, cbb3-type subunit I n=1 Tax=unclassified Campylobacter TaxID=2593542 RepID=UPI001BDA7573|nr:MULTISPECIES: cytochrome-c oxidase, cbb3-type subunit I [unclassified Campylobacter]MBZ7984399.1 cytochrome-c oxidase, cbb3-type subunit I [Campylobacter sp. RM12647]MBZ7991905.1 cytochrome-c oxidase, cbb3-type subunit I [Campylobacter sp. RM9331]MBZ7993669.1 cytochrome-c oxidase, cbb3-type subunit I [Campylobacter sp. RM9333]MBZ8006150.1 cytochrome-c oxidase, cbb3-type subunit I [Campylobacter sp. RM9332]MBT0880521.1 cytochrome-c oxidase, cbb3-type subunit I [Campylobacter sp. 2018MI27]